MIPPQRRSATVSWHELDPGAGSPEQIEGLAYVRGVLDGRLPADPMMEALGMRVTEVQEGRVVLSGEPAAQHMNLGGVVHGGYLTMLMDCAGGYALHTTLPKGRTAPHVAASYNFIRVGLEGVGLRCEARVLRSGDRIGHVRAEVTDLDGRLLATGESTHTAVDTDTDRRMQSGPSA